MRQRRHPSRRRNPDDDNLKIPLVQQVSAERGLIVIGGIPKADKLKYLQQLVGKKNIEWVSVESGLSARVVDSLVIRVRHGRVGALIFLEGLMSHKHFKVLTDAARISGVPFGYGGKAGKSSLAQALLDIEAALGSARRNPTRGYVVSLTRNGKEHVVSVHRTRASAAAAARRLRVG